MRKAWVVLILALLLCVSALAQTSPTGSNIYERVSPATVLIKTEDSAGTGFIVRPDGTIVTAFHVIDGATRVGIKTGSGEIFDNLSLLVKDERRDIAIIKIPGFELPAVELGNSNDVQPGQPIFVVGNPLGAEELQSTITDGIVSGIRDFGEGYKVIQISAPISRGNSGGPVLDDKGRVIGVAVFKIVAGESLNFAVPINYVRGLLGSISQSDPIQQWEGTPTPESIFGSEKIGGLTDYWKSSNGNLYYIKDHGDQVKILNLTATRYTYDFKWSGDLVIGFIYSGRTLACALRKIDDDHLHRVCFKYKKRYDDKYIRAEAEKRFHKPRDIWVRMR
jgi:hypothetical protein